MTLKRRICLVILLSFLTVTALVLGAFKISQTGYAEASEYTDAFTASKVIILQDKQHFRISFGRDVASEVVYDVHEDEKVSQYILINGVSVAEINANGKNMFSEKVEDGFHINVWKNDEEQFYGLHVFIKQELTKKWRLKLDGEDIITIKAGFTCGNVKVNEDMSLKYFVGLDRWELPDWHVDGTVGIKNITAVNHWTNEEQGTMTYFSIEFNADVCEEMIPFATYSAFADNMSVCGKTVTQILEKHGGVQGDYVCYYWETPNKLTMYICGDLFNVYTITESGTKLSLTADFTTPNGQKIDRAVSYTYYKEHGLWVEDKNVEREYGEINFTEVSDLFYDELNGTSYFVMYFDETVSEPYLPCVNADISWLQEISAIEGSGIEYSFKALQALIYDGIRDSVMDYLYINGKSIRQIIDGESHDIPKFTTLSVNLLGASFNTKAIQVVFSGNGDFAYDPYRTLNVEVKKGFTTPSYKKTTEDVVLKTGFEGFAKEEKKSGCKGKSGFTALPLTLLVAFVIVKKKVKKYE